MAKSDLKRIGVIALSFALEPEKEPNPCNKAMAREYERVIKLLREQGHKVFGVCQWEVNLAVKDKTGLVKVVAKHRDGNSYLDSDEVIMQANEAFKANGRVDEVVIIGNPWIHLQGAQSRAKTYGLKVRRIWIHWIGFDKNSIQWQTRGPIRAFLYTVIRVFYQVFVGRRFGQKTT